MHPDYGYRSKMIATTQKNTGLKYKKGRGTYTQNRHRGRAFLQGVSIYSHSHYPVVNDLTLTFLGLKTYEMHEANSSKLQ